ncbi:GTPase-activating protein [Acrasis kona]|uniref:GTPase-activating protein n=1 Tax=Acrasis kona TaxID=1008807 RepID=A0AAW2Z4B5_9EUKA
MVEIVQVDEEKYDSEEDTTLVIIKCNTSRVEKIVDTIRKINNKDKRVNNHIDFVGNVIRWVKSLFSKESLKEEWASFIDVFRFRVFDVIIVLAIGYLCKKFHILNHALGWIIQE